MNLSPEDKAKLPKTMGYYGAFLAFGLMEAALGPALPALAERTSSGFNQISLLFVVRSLGYLFGATVLGRIFDRVPGHPILAVVLIIVALISALIPAMSVLWLLILLLLIYGIAAGVLEVGANTLLTWVHRRNLAPWMNGLHFFFGFGAFLSPLIFALAISGTGGISWGFWIIALFILPPALWILFQASPEIRSKTDVGEDIPVNYRLVIPIALLFLLYVGAEVSFGGWIYTYTLTLHPGTETVAGYLTAAFWGAFTVGRLVAIPVSTRLRARIMLSLAFIGTFTSLFLIISSSGSLTAIWVAAIGMGLSMSSVFPTLLTFAEHRMPITARVNGWFFAGVGVGGMTLPWIIGQAFEQIGPGSTMLLILVDVLFALGIFIVLLYITRSRPTRVVV